MTASTRAAAGSFAALASASSQLVATHATAMTTIAATANIHQLSARAGGDFGRTPRRSVHTAAPSSSTTRPTSTIGTGRGRTHRTTADQSTHPNTIVSQIASGSTAAAAKPIARATAASVCFSTSAESASNRTALQHAGSAGQGLRCRPARWVPSAYQRNQDREYPPRVPSAGQDSRGSGRVVQPTTARLPRRPVR